MYTIRHATNAFAKIDKTLPEDIASLDKSLRHLSQRLYMPPMGRQGRADTFAFGTICALRLLQKASLFGLDRWQLEKLAQYLQIADPIGGGLSVKVHSGSAVLPPIEEAVRRVAHGETFIIGVAMLRDGTVKPFTDWPDNIESAKGADFLAEAGMNMLPEDARFSLPASRLIAELAEELEATE